MKMLSSIAFVLLLQCFLASSQTSGPNEGMYTKPTCGNNLLGKKEPSPQSDLHACKSYVCNSCCFPNITRELVHMPLYQVGGLAFDQCYDERKMSSACSTDTTYMECFYHCSPNLFPWITSTTKRLRHLPICASFCDSWFDACQSDLTCVTGKGNWKTDLYHGFNKDGTPRAPCKEGATCRNYTEVYKSGENMCNNIWGDLFVYTTDETACLNPAKPKENAKLVQNMNKTFEVSDCVTSEVHYTDPGLIVGAVFAALAVIFLIAAGAMFYLRKKKEKDSRSGKAKNKNLSPPEEMSSLRGSKKKASETSAHAEGGEEES